MHDDLVHRDFTAIGPDELWLTHIPPPVGGAPTSHRTAEGMLYLFAIKDVYSGRIVGYSIDSRMKSRLAVAAGCILHSERGSQFRSKKMHKTIT